MVHAPGRVNLIGEHTDYSHLPVLPMAIEQGITIAASGGGPGVEAVSTSEPGRVAFHQDGDMPPTGWGSYLWGAVKSVAPKIENPGVRLAVASDLPSTGGLASSSALTVGVLWALNTVWSLGLDRGALVDVAIRSERLVGVESGGMDQTVIVFAEPGTALRIDFEPPSRRAVAIPPDLGFAVGYSGSPAPKAGGAKHSYNRSVASCRAAAALLGFELGTAAGHPPSLSRFTGAGGSTIAALPDQVSANDAAVAAGLPVSMLIDLTAGRLAPDVMLSPRAAARHVLAEALRVDGAEVAITQADGPRLGELFTDSHRSLGEFGATTPQLDQLVDAATQAGAWGARLTGAGFGGWAVAVAPPSDIPQVVDAMELACGGPAFPVTASAGVR